MKARRKDNSVEEYRLVGTFQALRSTLLSDRYADRLDKPLAYWALPSDRRLPYAFLGRSLKNLLSTPFDELLATPGIGQKKVAALMTLLARATKDTPPDVPFGLDEFSSVSAGTPVEKDTERADSAFNPGIVSEALWNDWQATVKRYGLADQKLGRLAPALLDLPTVIWHTPLSEYLGRSLAEIRQLKTHGEKRVNAVLEVFCVAHEALSKSQVPQHLELTLVPSFVSVVERWCGGVLSDTHLPSEGEIRSAIVEPMLKQIETDAGPTVWRLATERLGMNGAALSVREQSKRMAVTRARIYQLLEECGKVLEVRWPEGERLLRPVAEKMKAHDPRAGNTRLFNSLVELFYPTDGGTEREAIADRLRFEVDPMLVRPAAVSG